MCIFMSNKYYYQDKQLEFTEKMFDIYDEKWQKGIKADQIDIIFFMIFNYFNRLHSTRTSTVIII